MGLMRILYAFVRTAFHNASIYRVDFWVSLLSVFIMMYASYSIWSILYTQNPTAFGMDLARMTTYGALGMLLVPIMGAAMTTQNYIATQVRAGTLEIDLMKPLPFLFHMFCRNAGEFCVQLCTRGVPGLLFAALFLDFRPPANLAAGLGFLASLGLGYLVFFALNFLMGLLAIVTLDIRSYSWAYNSLIRFASGQLVPLWLFPPALAAFVGALPFKEVFFVPMSIYIGAPETSLAAALLSQAAWAAGLLAAGLWFWSRCRRRIVVQGG